MAFAKPWSPLAFGCLAAAVWLSACCVAPPLTEEWMAVGFRSPEQTIKTFQTAVRADSPELEYRCFSAGFRSRNGISKLTWREVREELRKRYPWLRRGLVDARIENEVNPFGERAVVFLVSHGEAIRMELVREDFAELWSGEGLLSDEPHVDFDKQTKVQASTDGSRWFYGWTQLRTGPDGGPEVTEVRVGREWKIDAFEGIEPQQEGHREDAHAAKREEP